MFLEDLILSCVTSSGFPTFPWDHVQAETTRCLQGCPELCPQGYLIFGKDTPQPLNTNLQNFHPGLPQHPGMSCHAQHGAASQTGSTGGAGWSRIPSRNSCAKPVRGKISECQAGMSQPPRSVWAQQIFIGNLLMNWLQAGFTGRGRQGFGVIFGVTVRWR